MEKQRKIIGFGICGKGESERYLEATLKEFDRLCDETFIICNKCSEKETDLIKKFNFNIIKDDREWGKYQWKIKEDNIRDVLKKESGDVWVIALDMDEVFDKSFDREELDKLCDKGGTGYYFFITNLIDDGYSLDWSFWNVRLFNAQYDLSWERKALHCGLAPKIAYYWGNYAPFILKHYGLQRHEDRLKKAERYKQYDPNSQFKGKAYYDMLVSKIGVKPFNEDELHQLVADEVKDYKHKLPSIMEKSKPKKFYFVKNPYGAVVDIEEAHLQETLARQEMVDGQLKGFELVGTEPVAKGGSGVETTIPADEAPKEEKEKEQDDELVCKECGFISKSKAGLARHSSSHK